MQDDGPQAPPDVTGRKTQLPQQLPVQPKHLQQPQPTFLLPQPFQPPQPQQLQPVARPRQPLAKPRAAKPKQLLEDLEDDVSAESGGAARINVLSDEDDFDLVKPLPAPADAKRKQKLAGGRKKSRRRFCNLRIATAVLGIPIFKAECHTPDNKLVNHLVCHFCYVLFIPL
jgi:hypothetical protein